MSETMAHLQYMPGDPRLVDQLVYELKSKGIFDQFRKECIADVDTRPAYQNLRQRVESSVASFLARQTWKPDLNKNQLREKLRKHLLDGNYLEQGVERIVDQVVNPKVASVFIPQVEDLVYNYLGIPRKKPTNTETATATSSEKEDLLPTDLEAVSPGSVKSNEEKEDKQSVVEDRMEVDEIKEDSVTFVEEVKMDQDTRLSGMSELTINDTEASMDKASIPLPTEEIKLENIPAPENSPPNIKKENIDLEKINLPREPNLSTDIPLPDELPKVEKDNGFIKPTLHSEDDESVSDSDSSLRRNMSPLTPIRDFNTENSCDAQQGFENESDNKNQTPNEPSTFRFTIEGTEEGNIDKKEDQNAPCHFSNQINNTFNTPLYDDSSNSNNLQIDYESDVNSKAAGDIKLPEAENSIDSKKDKKDEKKSNHKSSHRSRDSHRDSSSKEKKDHKSSRDSTRHDKKPKDKDSKSHKDKSETEKKDSKDSKHRSSSHKSSHKDSKHRSSSSSKHSSSKDDKKSSSSCKDKTEKSSRDKDRSSNSRSSSHRSEKDRKSDKSKSKDEKENRDKKKGKKEADDHYSLSGRGSHTRRSTDRDSNDGSSSSKGSQNQVTKASDAKKPSKSSSKAGTSASSTSDSPSDKDHVVTDTQLTKDQLQFKPIVRVNHLDTPSKLPKRLPFVPDVTIKKPRFATNMEEAKQKMKMRKFFEEEQKRMNQEAALLLEFQANVRPSLSQVYSSIPGPELEFACVNTVQHTTQVVVENVSDSIETESNQSKAVAETVLEKEIDANKSFENEVSQDIIAETLIAMHREHNTKKEVSNEDNEMIIVVQEQDNRTVLETLTGVDQDSITENQGDTISVELHVPEEVDTGVDVEENPNIEKGMEMNSPSEIKEKIGADESINFEVSIIGEELSDDEEPVLEIDESGVDNEAYDEAVEQNKAVDQETEVSVKIAEDIDLPEDEIPLEYFAEHEKYKSELENDIFDKFLKSFIQQVSTRVMFLMNCDTYEENLIKEAAKSFGNYEIVTYHKNGHVKVPKSDKKVVKDLNVTREVILPTESYTISSKYNSPMFSPKSECSFELSSDYDAKLEEMVNNTSRKQIMEIILGGAAEESPSEMPQIDYCSESNIDIQQEQSIKTKTSEIKKGKEENETKKDFNTESIEKTKTKQEVKTVDAFDADADDFDIEQAISVYTIDKNSCRKERERIDEQKEQKESLKRRMEMESSNNNCPILTPNKMRRVSESHQITSTTGEESTPVSQNKTPSRSKYLGKAKWVGLPKPKKPAPSPNSPSSDKSVENYEQLPKNPKQPNGKLKTPRTKVQRYDTSDLYKPKLHYLSRRNNVT